jgi:hypothetical protein
MELKDVILSTLAEMEDESPEFKEALSVEEAQTESVIKEEKPLFEQNSTSVTVESELIFLNSIRERLLVLFEGFQAPNNANIEAKIDMTLNFLEYTLATIDARVEKLEKGNRP